MASTINASTVSGIVQSADTSGVLALQTGGTTAITVDASQNVGVGTSTPTGKFHVNRSTTGVSATFTAVDGTYDTALQISHGSSGVTLVNSNPYSGGYNNLIFSNSSVGETMRIDASGRVTTPYVPAFHVGQPNAASGFSANSVCKWPTNTLNNGGYFKTSAGTGQYERFIAPVAGYYHFNVLILSNQSVQLFYSIRKNGAGYPGTNIETVTSTNFQSATATATMYLAAGDYVDVYMGSNPAYGSSYANFNGYLIG